MELRTSNEKLKNFIKTGIVVLTLLVILGLGVKYIPKVIDSISPVVGKTTSEDWNDFGKQ